MARILRSKKYLLFVQRSDKDNLTGTTWFLFYPIFGTTRSCAHINLNPDSCWLSQSFDWCCFYYFQRNSLVALLEALFARIFLHLRYRCAEIFFIFFFELWKYKFEFRSPNISLPISPTKTAICLSKQYKLVPILSLTRFQMCCCWGALLRSRIFHHHNHLFPLLVAVLRWGWVFLERTRILSGIQFTTHFIELFVVETKRFVGSFVNVILTQQTCGERSSRAAERKRRALENYFSEWICYMFLMSKCRGDWDPGLCTTSVLAKREPLRNGDFRKKTCFARSNNRHMTLCNGSLFASTEVVHRYRS